MFSSIVNVLKPKINLFYQVANIHVTSPACKVLKFPSHKMIKDIKVRKTVEENYFERLNLNCLRKNKIIPREIQELAHEQIKGQPRFACPIVMHNRCVITSRPRGLIKRWRMSRIAWRNQVDYNKVAGVQRAMW